jgi:hypothetical protein
MDWNVELTYLVTPKSGPMRAMQTLRDLNYAFLDDLTAHCSHRGHWYAVGRLLVKAATSRARLDVMLVTEALMMALETEGWMTAQRVGPRMSSIPPVGIIHVHAASHFVSTAE